MEQRTSTLRLRRVHFKDGRASIKVIPQRMVQEERREVGELVRECMSSLCGHIAGFAFVVWSHDTASAAELRNYYAAMPRAMVPEFVRERLRHEITERWTRQGLREDGVI